jgi:hypothetical protein
MRSQLSEMGQKYHSMHLVGLPVHYLDFGPGFELLVE